MTTKTCNRCDETKPQTEFYSNGRGGLRGECKACTMAKRPPGREAARDAEARYRERHRVELAERQAAWRKAHPGRWREIATQAQRTWRAKNG